jgi:hypothetical protein
MQLEKISLSVRYYEGSKQQQKGRKNVLVFLAWLNDRSTIVASLVQISRNKRVDDSWYAGINMLDLAAYGGAPD